jgi:hypothetical protein
MQHHPSIEHRATAVPTPGGEAHDTTARLRSELGEAIANLLADGRIASGIHKAG